MTFARLILLSAVMSFAWPVPAPASASDGLPPDAVPAAATVQSPDAAAQPAEAAAEAAPGKAAPGETPAESMVDATGKPVYDSKLTGFPYPYPVQEYAFRTQGEDLWMAYMDVVPKTPNGKTAVLFHGKNFCSATWDTTIAALNDAGYRVIAIDQIGFCKSAKPYGYQYSFNQLAENTRALLETLKVYNATIVGHSLGGMLAARYALNYPTLVDRLVLVNPIGLEDWQAKGVPYVTLETLNKAELDTTRESIRAYQQEVYYHGNWKPEYDRWVDMLGGMYLGPERQLVAWNQAQASDMLLSQPVMYQFGQIRVPTTLMIGMLDRTAPGANRASRDVAARLGDYPALAADAARAIPNAKLIPFPTLGHAPQVEDPAAFNRALVDALAH